MSNYVAKITANGVTYSMPMDRELEWTVYSGPDARVQSWVMPAETARSIMSSLGDGTSREVTLTMGDPADPETFERIYVIGTAPADNPQRLRLLMSDIRFYLHRAVFVMDANVRRRLGDRRLIGTSLEESEVVDTVAYASWSIKDGEAFTWDSLKNSTLDFLAAPRHGRPGFQWTTDALSLEIDSKQVQETTTDGDGTDGLAEAIEALPGAGVYVHPGGVIHVHDARPGAESTLVGQLGSKLWRHGDLQLVDLAGLRPSKWRIYVDYALEVRFNYNVPAASGDALSHLCDLENVLRVTDQSLMIPAGAWGPARTVGEGTWITLDEAFAAWGSKTYGPLTLPALTHDFVADHWLGDYLQVYCAGGTEPDQVWVDRIQELMKCFRTYFRVNSTFWDRVRHFWNVRAAIWDPVTGTRGPSPVYSNYHYTLNEVGSLSADEASVFGKNVLTSLTVSSLLSEGKATGFEVDIVDQELMVIAINRNVKKFPNHVRVLPSPTIDGVTVTGTPGNNEAHLQRLVHTWSLATIMTCSPAAPNDYRRLYEIVVELPEVVDLVKLEDAPTENHAPDQELRSHMVEARVAWQDDETVSKGIWGTFGRTDTGDLSPYDPIRTLTPINLEQELRPLARAIAASDYVSRLDCYVGDMSVPMDADIVPIGSITSVTHRVSLSRAVSEIHAERPASHENFVKFLPPSARGWLLKEIQKAR